MMDDGYSRYGRASPRSSRKRGRGDDYDVDMEGRRAEGDQCTVDLVVPSSTVGIIIGKGGAHVREISEATHCKVAVRGPPDSRHPDDRVVSVSGSMRNVARAQLLIMDKIREGGSEGRQPSNAGGPLKWLVPNDLVGGLIGKGGHGITAIVSESGAQVRVSPLEEMPAGSRERIVAISGSQEQVSRALSMIRSAAGGRPYDGYIDGSGVVLHVPNKLVGHLIGKSGSHVKHMSEASGAKIKIAGQEDVAFGSSERSVTISGTPEQVRMAKDMIRQKLIEKGGTYTAGDEITTKEQEELSLKMMIPGAGVGRLIGRGGTNIREITQASGAHLKIFSEEEMDPAAGVRLIVLTGTERSILDAQRRVLERLEQEDRNFRDERDYKSERGRGEGGYGAVDDMRQNGSSQADMYNPGQPQLFPGIKEERRNFESSRSSSSSQTVVKITVPERVVGLLIGKKGATIRSLNELTNAHIDVAAKEDTPRGADREITITGTPQNVAMAEQLIHNRIRDDKGPPGSRGRRDKESGRERERSTSNASSSNYSAAVGVPGSSVVPGQPAVLHLVHVAGLGSVPTPSMTPAMLQIYQDQLAFPGYASTSTPSMLVAVPQGGAGQISSSMFGGSAGGSGGAPYNQRPPSRDVGRYGAGEQSPPLPPRDVYMDMHKDRYLDGDRYGGDERRRDDSRHRDDDRYRDDYREDYRAGGNGRSRRRDSRGRDRGDDRRDRSRGRESSGRDNFGRESFGRESFGRENFGRENFGRESLGGSGQGADSSAKAMAELTLAVPVALIGAIIGKGGANVKRISAESGADVKIQPQSELQKGDTMRRVTIRGAAMNVEGARKLIDKVLVEEGRTGR